MGARHWVAGDRNDLGNDAGSSSLDNASLMGLAEPFWLQLGARVETLPCTNADELREGLSRL